VGIVAPISSAELPRKKYLNLAAIRTIVAEAYAAARPRSHDLCCRRMRQSALPAKGARCRHQHH
jgi:hypothetical protein